MALYWQGARSYDAWRTAGPADEVDAVETENACKDCVGTGGHRSVAQGRWVDCETCEGTGEISAAELDERENGPRDDASTWALPFAENH